MIYDRSNDGLAEGCCSAVRPCSQQQRDPNSLCDICTRTWVPNAGAPSPITAPTTDLAARFEAKREDTAGGDALAKLAKMPSDNALAHRLFMEPLADWARGLEGRPVSTKELSKLVQTCASIFTAATYPNSGILEDLSLAIHPFATCCDNHFHDASILDSFDGDHSVLHLIRDGKLSPTGVSVEDLRRARDLVTALARKPGRRDALARDMARAGAASAVPASLAALGTGEGSGGASSVTARDDIKCQCVGSFGPNAECGACGGSGCVGEVETVLPHPQAPNTLSEVDEDGWQPISTGPRDGTLVGIRGSYADGGKWESRGWYEASPADRCWYDALDEEPCKPTEWKLLAPTDAHDIAGAA